MTKKWCEGCTHLDNKDTGCHCYVFKTMPSNNCMQHSKLKRHRAQSASIVLAALLGLVGPPLDGSSFPMDIDDIINKKD
jgi:hypothetical protein